MMTTALLAISALPNVLGELWPNIMNAAQSNMQVIIINKWNSILFFSFYFIFQMFITKHVLRLILMLSTMEKTAARVKKISVLATAAAFSYNSNLLQIVVRKEYNVSLGHVQIILKVKLIRINFQSILFLIFKMAVLKRMPIIRKMIIMN